MNTSGTLIIKTKISFWDTEQNRERGSFSTLIKCHDITLQDAEIVTRQFRESNQSIAQLVLCEFTPNVIML
jgi:hypothetical protein